MLAAATLMAGMIAGGALPFAATAAASCSTCARAFDGASYTGTEKDFSQGVGNADLSTISFDNKISSIEQTLAVGHGFIWWTDADYQGSSFKACATAAYPSLGSPYNNALSSVEATLSCPD